MGIRFVAAIENGRECLHEIAWVNFRVRCTSKKKSLPNFREALLFPDLEDQVVVFMELAAVLKVFLILPPKRVNTPMTTRAMSEMSKPYSTRVWPSSSCKNCLIMMMNVFLNLRWTLVSSYSLCRTVFAKINFSVTSSPTHPL